MRKRLIIFMVIMSMTIFTSCSNNSDDSDDDSSSSAVRVASYCGIDDTNNRSIICNFYNDNTWVANICDASSSFYFLFVGAKGSYTGVPAGDGIIFLVFTHYADSDENLKELSSPQSETITITNGKATYNGIKYYRQLLNIGK